MDELVSVVEELPILVKDLQLKVEAIEIVKNISTKIKDLYIYRWNEEDPYDILICSSNVNNIVDECDYTQDKLSIDLPDMEYAIAWPYVVIDNAKVYSNPPKFIVGHDNQLGFGIAPTKEWKSEVESNNIAIKVIKDIEMFLLSRAQVNYLV